jgi:DNA-binding MarR family transcriptional regulator
LTLTTVAVPPSKGNSLITELCRTANILRTHLDNAVLRQERLRLSGFDVLQVICQSGPLQARTAAARLGIAKGTLTGIATQLIARGLVKREIHPGDRRRVILSPTTAGLKLARRIRARVDAEEQRLLHLSTPLISPHAAATLRYLAEAGHPDPPHHGDT